MKNLIKLLFFIFLTTSTTDAFSQINKRAHIGFGVGKSHSFYTFLGEKRIGSLSISKVSSGLIQKITDNESIDFIYLGWYLNTAVHRLKNDWLYEDAVDISLSTGLKVELNIFDMIEKFTGNPVDLKGLEVYTGFQTGPEYIAYLPFDEYYVGEFLYKFNPYIGVRYFLNERIGFFLDLGRTNYGIANIGVAFGKSK